MLATCGVMNGKVYINACLEFIYTHRYTYIYIYTYRYIYAYIYTHPHIYLHVAHCAERSKLNSIRSCGRVYTFNEYAYTQNTYAYTQNPYTRINIFLTVRI